MATGLRRSRGAAPRDSGEGGLGRLSDMVQFQIEFGVCALAQFGDLGLEVGDPAPKLSDLHHQGLFRTIAYVPEQSARHVGDPSLALMPGSVRRGAVIFPCDPGQLGSCST